MGFLGSALPETHGSPPRLPSLRRHSLWGFIGSWPHSVTVYNRGPIRALYDYSITILQLSTSGWQYLKVWFGSRKCVYDTPELAVAKLVPVS